jgi:hypothetical protein
MHHINMIVKFCVYPLRNAHDIMKIVEVTQKGMCNIFERHHTSPSSPLPIKPVLLPI